MREGGESSATSGRAEPPRERGASLPLFPPETVNQHLKSPEVKCILAEGPRGLWFRAGGWGRGCQTVPWLFFQLHREQGGPEVGGGLPGTMEKKEGTEPSLLKRPLLPPPRGLCKEAGG